MKSRPRKTFLEKTFSKKYSRRFRLRYVGNGYYWISVKDKNGKTLKFNPDFIKNPVIENRKVIEVNSLAFHTEEEAKERVKLYYQAGWECLVVWETEINDCKEKLEKFVAEHFTLEELLKMV
jgi:G:T-mismatch repair DNA endonuclease (very short patch repair protein)